MNNALLDGMLAQVEAELSAIDKQESSIDTASNDLLKEIGYSANLQVPTSRTVSSTTEGTSTSTLMCLEGSDLSLSAVCAIPCATSPSLSPSPTSSLITKWGNLTDFLAAAMYWYGYDFKVIPIGPASKITAVKWDQWLDNLSSQTIKDYWTEHPDHELGFIVGDDIIVFDADGPESVAALAEIEVSFGMTPKIVVNTSQGQHHYYHRAADTVAKSDSHSSEKYPDRLDIKTGRALVILPPSTGKSILVNTAQDKDELSEATQAFIDAIFEHNGRTAPSEVKAAPSPTPRVAAEESDDDLLKKLQVLLNSIDPDCGYEDWRNVLMAVFHETQGSDDGLAQVDAWSCKGKKYKGTKDIETKWKSFRLDVERPVTIGTLIKMAKDSDAFEICDYEVISSTADVPEKANITNEASIEVVNKPDVPEKALEKRNSLDKYSLQGMSKEIEKRIVEQVHIFDDLALMGESTVLYAAPNTGKTLLTLNFLIQSIKQKRVDPTRIYYINVDDSAKGLLEKLQIAEEYGFHMLAEGYRNFKAKDFLNIILKMTESAEAHGVTVILDTTKKFTDLMDKRTSSHFAGIVRAFVMQGGTVIALAHTNKKKRDGKPVYAGTTDILDDFDCGYILDTVSADATSNQKVVEFTNIKKRGDVTNSVAYSYTMERGVSYNELLLSVQEIDPNELESTKHEAETKTDAEIIDAISSCIKDGINTKMELAGNAAERVKTSKRSVIKVVEKYYGTDPAFHLWTFDVRERGAKVFRLLERPAEPSPTPAMATP